MEPVRARPAATGANDFLNLYAGGTLAGTPNLYDQASVRTEELRARGLAWFPFLRLPYYALLLKPLTWLPYQIAYEVCEALLVAAWVGFGSLWPHARTGDKWIVCCWSLPLWVGVFNGQDAALLLLWVALAVWLLRGGREAAAGVALALCASKYHLVVLVPLVIVAQRRWRMAAGAAGTIMAMLAVSFLIAGASWPLEYWAALRLPCSQIGLDHMANLHALFAQIPFGLTLEAAMALAIAAAVFVAARHTDGFEGPLALALVGGLLVSPHTYLADCALLLPALTMAADGGTAGGRARVSATALATPVPWFLLQLPWPLPAITRVLMIGLVYGLAGRLGLGWRWTGADRSTPAGASAGKTA